MTDAIIYGGINDLAAARGLTREGIHYRLRNGLEHPEAYRRGTNNSGRAVLVPMWRVETLDAMRSEREEADDE